MAYLHRRNNPRKQRFCSICSEMCSFSYIFCDTCSLWVHNNCDMIGDEKVQQYERLPSDFPYICRKCRCDEEASLDYEKCLQRLHRAAIQGIKKLKGCVKREELFLDGPFIGVSGVGSLAVDLNAQSMMEKYLPKDKGIPAAVSNTDHVLFRAVSLAVCAKDSLACELRVRCCIEMVNFASYYRYQKSHHMLARCAPDYTESCIDCALVDEGSSIWTLSGLASVVRRPIMSVYPNVNGPSDPAVQALNAVFQPREGEFNCQLVRILWCSEATNIMQGKWKPNHFVPLFDQQRQEAPSPAKDRGKQELDSSQDTEADFENFEDAFEAEFGPESAGEEAEAEQLQIPMPLAEGGEQIDFGKFMDVFEAYEKITTATIVNSEIPRGVKENVWFLIDNSHNVQHPERRNTFFDDCGVWDSKHGSVAKSHLLLDDKGILCTLKIHAGVFKQLSKTRGKQHWVTIDPQPDPDRVVVCHRYYAFLKRCPTYKRRIIWFTMPPSQEAGKDVALVEYLGKFPGFPAQRHGNARRGRGGSRNYVRTDPKLLEEISEQIKQGTNLTPMKIFKEIQKKLGSTSTLRDPRQIRNLKYSILKRARQAQGKGAIVPKQEPEEFTTISLQETGEVSIDEAGNATMGTEISKSDYDQGLIKVIIHQGDGEMGEMVQSVEEITEGSEVAHSKILQMEDGQQAISFMETDTNGMPDPSTRTVIMVKDLNAALAASAGASEVMVTHPI
ncbi:uncharacterized protein [Littorina saxatilis]|uniref:PHD-type domain-containing protein n=1 Tax=Littorina saxatilis TaxID=31220 RepID=A0AAN9GGK6_9CAEN